MDKNKTLKNRIIAVIYTLALIVILLFVATRLLERKVGRIKNSEFYEGSEDYDVIFFGSSHMVNGVYPMELWNEQGITSFNLGQHNSFMATTYWTYKNAILHKKPKLIVLDCYGLSSDRRWKRSGLLHDILDYIPLSRTKADTLNDLFCDEEMNDPNKAEEDRDTKKWEYIWDFIAFHSRWNELEAGDLKCEYGREKGAESRINVADTEYHEAEKLPELQNAVSEDYLVRLIEDCKAQGIDVLLIYLPFPAPEEQQAEAVRAAEIAEEYGLNYINFLDEDIIDYTIDCYDPDSHLNPSGARKVTKYLGDYISENYDMADHRSDSRYTAWADDYSLYRSFKDENLKKEEKLSNYLMLLYGDDLEVSMDIYDNSWTAVYPYDYLLGNLGIDPHSIVPNTHIEISGGQPVISTSSYEIEYSEVVVRIEVKRKETIDTTEFVKSAEGYIRK